MMWTRQEPNVSAFKNEKFHKQPAGFQAFPGERGRGRRGGGGGGANVMHEGTPMYPASQTKLFRI